MIALVVTFNSEESLPGLLDDLGAVREFVSQVIVVDNASHDGTAQVVAEHSFVQVIHPGFNCGYAAAINIAVRECGGSSEDLLILNPDIRISYEAVRTLAQSASKGGPAIRVPRVCERSGGLAHSLRREPSLLTEAGDAIMGSRLARLRGPAGEIIYTRNQYVVDHDVAWATGAALLVSSEVSSAVGPWDERFFLYSEETDYFRRVRDAGYSCTYVAEARVTHARGGSGSNEFLDALLIANKLIYFAKWHGRFAVACMWVLLLLRCSLRIRQRSHRVALGCLLGGERKRKLLVELLKRNSRDA